MNGRKNVIVATIKGIKYLKCNKCEEFKELNEENFYKDKSSSIGFKSICKSCKKQYYKDNKDERLRYQKKYIEENKDYYKAYIKQYNNGGKDNVTISKKNSTYENDIKNILNNTNKEKLINIEGESNYKGRKYTRLVGGFGNNSPIITTKQIAELLGIKNYHVVEVINRNIKCFTKEYLKDLKVIVQNDNNYFSYEDIGYNKMAWSKSKNVYILSEAGFLLYLKFADGDKAVELYKDFIEDYFKTKVELQVAEHTLEQDREEFIKTKATLIGQAVMCKDEVEQIKIMKNIEEINNRIIEIEKTLSKKETEEKYKEIGYVADRFLNTDNCYNMNTFCKVINIKGYGRNNMFKYLRNKKVLRKDNTPYQPYMDKFKVIMHENNGHTTSQTLVNGEGVKYIVKKLKKDNIINDIDLDDLINKLNKEIS